MSGRKLTGEERDLIHPSVRARVPVGSTRLKLANLGRQLAAAEEVANIDVSKLHHLPATIDATQFFNSRKVPGKIYEVEVNFKGHPEARRVKADLKSRVYVSPMPKGNFLIMSYGTQGSTKLAELPAENTLHRVYDYGIPTQSLALVSHVLTRQKTPEGKTPKVFVIGRDLTNERRGIDRDEVKETVSAYADNLDTFDEPSRRRLRRLADNWETTSTHDKQKVINEVFPWHRLMGIPWHVINKNYHEIPLNMGATSRPLGSIADKETLATLSARDPSGLDYNKLKHMDVHELDTARLEPMGHFMKAPKA